MTPIPEPISTNLPSLDELRATLCAVGIVGQIDGYDVIRRESVIELVDRRRAAIAQDRAARAQAEPVAEVNRPKFRTRAESFTRAIAAAIEALDHAHERATEIEDRIMYGAAGMLLTIHTAPTIPQAAEVPGFVPEGFWLAPMEADTEMLESYLAVSGKFMSARTDWNAMRDSWLARHPAAPTPTARSAPPTMLNGLTEAETCASASVAGLSSWRAVSEWRPIETAPKDGTWLLVAGPDQTGARRMVCRWSDGCWESADGFFAYINPTHWMPLPAPPTVGSGSATEGKAK